MSYPGTARVKTTVATTPATINPLTTNPPSTVYPGTSPNVQQFGASRCTLWWLHISNVVLFVYMFIWPFLAIAVKAEYDEYCSEEYGISDCDSYENCNEDEYCSLYDEYGYEEDTWWFYCSDYYSYSDYTCEADGSYQDLVICLFVFVSIGIFFEFIRLIAALNLCSQNTLTVGGCDCCSTLQRNGTLSYVCMIGDSIFFRFLHCNPTIYGLSMERYDRGEFFVFGNWWWITNFLTCTVPAFICFFVLVVKRGSNTISLIIPCILYIVSLILKMRYRGQYRGASYATTTAVVNAHDPRAVAVMPGMPVYGQPIAQTQVQYQTQVPVMMVQMPDGSLAPANPNITYVQAQPQGEMQPVSYVQPQQTYVQPQAQTYVQPQAQVFVQPQAQVFVQPQVQYIQPQQQAYAPSPVASEQKQNDELAVAVEDDAPPAYGMVVHGTAGQGSGDLGEGV